MVNNAEYVDNVNNHEQYITSNNQFATNTSRNIHAHRKSMNEFLVDAHNKTDRDMEY